MNEYYENISTKNYKIYITIYDDIYNNIWWWYILFHVRKTCNPIFILAFLQLIILEPFYGDAPLRRFIKLLVHIYISPLLARDVSIIFELYEIHFWIVSPTFIKKEIISYLPTFEDIYIRLVLFFLKHNRLTLVHTHTGIH